MFPINRWVGSRDSAAVYFEVKPGDRLARHPECRKVLYVVTGEAEAVGNERARLTLSQAGPHRGAFVTKPDGDEPRPVS